jgi:hypothetical protein
MKCECGTELIWGGDHDIYEENPDDSKGIETNYSCPNEECDVVTVFVIKEFKDA